MWMDNLPETQQPADDGAGAVLVLCGEAVPLGRQKKMICVLGAQNLGRNPLFSAGGCFLKTSTVKAGDERTRFQGSNVTLAWTWKEHKVK